MLSTLLSGNFTMQQIFANIFAVLMVVFLILPFHEWAHAITAYCLGDKSIKATGRLTINPLSHIDPIGALMLLLIGFGWAKPVPINPNYFKHPKLGMAITAFMGPFANLVAAFVGMLIYNFIALNFPDVLFNSTEFASMQPSFVWYFFSYYVSINISLAVFNLIPIPPLDGSKVLFLFLPNRAVEFMYRYQRVFYMVLFVLLWVGALNGVLGFFTGWVGNGISWLAELPFKPFMH